MVAAVENIVKAEAPIKAEAEKSTEKTTTTTTTTTTPTAAAQPAAARERARSQKGEPATEHTFDPVTKKWNTKTVWVTLEGRPFTEGSMRWCFRLVNHSMPEKSQKMVGKMYKAQGEPRATYFTEVEMQATCASLAEEFNKSGPPKKIKFIIPKVLEFHHRRWNDGNALIMAMEPMLAGEYKKHSNNYGYVNPVERNTPQAFSHWTYIHTKGQMLVCDMQGVEDTYTDPQIHTPDLRFGIADMGTDGVQKFFQTHRCNAICQHLGLHQTSFKPTKYSGTVVAPRNTSPTNNLNTSGFGRTTSPSKLLGSPVVSRVSVASPQQGVSPLTSSPFSTPSFMPLTDTSMLSYMTNNFSTTPFYSSFGTTSYMAAGITA